MGTGLLWFRRDLRLNDNPALQALLDDGHTPLPVYIHDEPDPDWQTGAASGWWLHFSLAALKKSLQQRGSDLLVLAGDTRQRLLELASDTGAGNIYWNRCYEPACRARDASLKQALVERGIAAHCHGAALLREPAQNLKKDGTPYRVFTPFWKALQGQGPARALARTPAHLPALPGGKRLRGLSVDGLGLLPAIPWDRAFYEHWQPGEAGAWAALENFCAGSLPDYSSTRDIPGRAGTTRLSPHLHFGEISPLQLWHHLEREAAGSSAPGMIAAIESCLRQIGWREFSHHLLCHFPQTATEPLDPRFARFPWRTDYADMLSRWQRGQTGIPIVDAGMRELWATGWMHNRVRMVTASFLTKNLRIPWQEGSRWFWDTLVDADLANNTMGWQWTAGCGADAAPYFRVFNPVLQGEKFDRVGTYVRRWVPELAKLENRYIHKPWAADPAILAEAGIRPGENYPQPLVDLQASRREALASWDRIKRQPDGKSRSG